MKLILLVFISLSLEVLAKPRIALMFNLSLDEGAKNSFALASKVLDFTGAKTVHSSADPLEIQRAVTEAKKLWERKKDSEILVYFVGHGRKGSLKSQSKKYASIWLRYEDIALLLGEAFKNSELTLIVDACESGSCIEKCAPIADRIITASDSVSPTFWVPLKNEDGCLQIYTSFSYHFFSALLGQYPDGTKIEADSNGNGRISYEEAFYHVQNSKTLGVNGSINFLGLGKLLTKPFFNKKKSRPQMYHKKH